MPVRTMLCAAALLSAVALADEGGFVDHFDVKPDNFASVGRNDCFILEPGYQHI